MPDSPAPPPIALVLHGGAGVRPEELSAERATACRVALRAATDTGRALLLEGASALAAVQAAICVLEDCPLFNAGRGAYLTDEGIAELDASVMDGQTGRAGAVAGVRRIRNPINGAVRVMKQSPHVLMVGEGAERFLTTTGMELVAPEFFITEERLAEWQKRHQSSGKIDPNRAAPHEKIGTVGAVALDRDGHLAAGTSTGGTPIKLAGRVGDSPIIGAGTYADDATCAISATGDGEYFIRAVAAHDIAARMRYGGVPLASAMEATLAGIGRAGGAGGFIGLTSNGLPVMRCNTPGMYRAWWSDNGTRGEAIFEPTH